MQRVEEMRTEAMKSDRNRKSCCGKGRDWKKKW